ncbi:LacI family DNA-binding transcriptional regulator [Dellaglioa sp. L3N]
MSNINDVARQSGYSIKTISRAINDPQHVSEKAKRKIFDVMKKLDYYPNSIAQQLRGKGTKLIGVIVSYITNPFFSYLVDAIEKYAANNDYQIIVLQTLDSADHQEKFIEMLKKRQLDGLIIASIEDVNDDIKRFVQQGKIVLCNRYVADKTIPSIHIDEKKATYDAISYLLKKGYKKIVYCTGGVNDKTDQRFNGYLQALEEYSVPFNKKFHLEDRWSISDGRELVNDFMMLPTNNRPDAIFANGDELAAGILSQCNMLSIKVPDELAIVGFDDQPMSTVLTPQLTTVRQPIKEMGEHAAAVLIANLKGSDQPAAIKLKTSLIIRGTA